MSWSKLWKHSGNQHVDIKAFKNDITLSSLLAGSPEMSKRNQKLYNKSINGLMKKINKGDILQTTDVDGEKNETSDLVSQILKGMQPVKTMAKKKPGWCVV